VVSYKFLDVLGQADKQNIHGIGDRANKIILDAIESIIGHDAQAKSEPHFRLEHAQIMRVEDVERATKLGAIGSYQATHATSDVSSLVLLVERMS
jgi:predicted amidohydrolase YtcJ